MVGSAREGIGGIREIEAVKLVMVAGESTWGGFICLVRAYQGDTGQPIR